MRPEPNAHAPRTSQPSAAIAAGAIPPTPLALAIRPIQPSDRHTIERGFEALTSDSKYNRFHAPLRSLPERLARYLTEVDGIDHVALIAFEPDADAEAIGVARFVRNLNAPATAELAITIADRFQSRGVGSRLLARLADAARARGVHTFTMDVLKGNRKARGFVAKLGAIPQGVGGEVVRYHLPVDKLGTLAAVGGSAQ